MKDLRSILGCGLLSNDSRNPNVAYLTVARFSDIRDKIIPFFIENPLQGAKLIEFEDFCKIVKIIENKGHLTTEGFEQIKFIISNMNTKRVP